MKIDATNFAKLVALMPPVKVNKRTPESVKETVFPTTENLSILVFSANNDADAIALLNNLKQEKQQIELQRLVQDIRLVTLDKITSAFGIGRVLASLDKNGGSVNTLHNAENGIYATTEAAYEYESRAEYKSDDYYKDKAYKDAHKADSKLQDEGTLSDAYTGKLMARNIGRDLDHVISKKEIHNDPKRILAKMSGEELANKPTNLCSTHQSINRAKKAKSASEFADELSMSRESRRGQILELQTQEQLTDKQKNRLEKLKCHDEVNTELLRSTDREARTAYSKEINQQYYFGDEFKEAALKSGIDGAMKMGAQQALGLALRELVSALSDEAYSIWKDGFKENNIELSLIDAIRLRLNRVAYRLVDQWKNVLTSLIVGGISGFLSSLSTVLINALITTSKRLIRLIREGAHSLLSAIKLVIKRPNGMTGRQAAHESSKLLATGVLVSGGILLEEYIEKMALSMGIPFATEITAICLSLITGMSTVMLMLLIDKFDIFGQKAIEDKDALHSILDQQIASSMRAIDGYAAIF